MADGNTGSIVIKTATREDIPVLVSLIRELAEFENLLDQVRADEANMTEALFHPDSTVFGLIIYYDSVPAGYCIYFLNFSTFLARSGLYVEDLYIRPRFRRLGLGKAVFGELGRLAAKKGCGRMELAVLDWNRTAIDFYKSMGASPLDEWRLFRFSGKALEKLAEL